MCGRNLQVNAWTGSLEQLELYLKDFMIEPNTAINVYTHNNALFWVEVRLLDDCLKQVIRSLNLEYHRTIRFNIRLGLIQ